MTETFNIKKKEKAPFCVFNMPMILCATNKTDDVGPVFLSVALCVARTLLCDIRFCNKIFIAIISISTADKTSRKERIKTSHARRGAAAGLKRTKKVIKFEDVFSK